MKDFLRDGFSWRDLISPLAGESEEWFREADDKPLNGLIK